MDDQYELWDSASSNLIGTYPTEAAALRVIAEAVARLGQQSVATVAFGREDDFGRLLPIAKGHDLIQLAKTHTEPSRGPL